MSQRLTSMALILTTAFIAVTVLALPSSNDALVPRDFPPPLGSGQGQTFSPPLTFKVYAEEHCNGDPAAIYTGSYGLYEPYQMQSYHLSRTLNSSELLDFYSGSRTDPSDKNSFNDIVNGHYTEACWIYDTRAGLNATTEDQADIYGEHHGKQKGCHTLVENEWCAIIWIQQTDA